MKYIDSTKVENCEHEINLIKKSLKIRIRKSKKNRKHYGQKMKNRKHYGQKMKNRKHYGQKMKNRKHYGQKKKHKLSLGSALLLFYIAHNQASGAVVVMSVR
jgi:hypothetical protein